MGFCTEETSLMISEDTLKHFSAASGMISKKTVYYAPLKKRLLRYEPDEAEAREGVLAASAFLASEEGSAFVDDDDDLGDLAKTYDLAPRTHKLDESEEWVQRAKKCSLALLTGQKKHVIWWRTKKAGPFALSHLPFSLRTGVHEFRIPPSVCKALNDYINNSKHRDTNGFFVMDGDTWPGYGSYDLVHSEMGCVPRLQEVRAHAHTDAHTHTLVATPAPMPTPLPITAPDQLKTMRVRYKRNVDRWLSNVPALADLVKEVSALTLHPRPCASPLALTLSLIPNPFSPSHPHPEPHPHPHPIGPTHTQSPPRRSRAAARWKEHQKPPLPFPGQDQTGFLLVAFR